MHRIMGIQRFANVFQFTAELLLQFHVSAFSLSIAATLSISFVNTLSDLLRANQQNEEGKDKFFLSASFILFFFFFLFVKLCQLSEIRVETLQLG